MVKSSEFHRYIIKYGKKRGWKWLKGEGEGLRKKIIKDMELEYA